MGSLSWMAAYWQGNSEDYVPGEPVATSGNSYREQTAVTGAWELWWTQDHLARKGTSD
jgi:hypothetical protein